MKSVKKRLYLKIHCYEKNGGNITDFVGNEIACIDHHPTFKECQYRYKDVRIVGACSTIIADYFRFVNRFLQI